MVEAVVGLVFLGLILASPWGRRMIAATLRASPLEQRDRRMAVLAPVWARAVLAAVAVAGLTELVNGLRLPRAEEGYALLNAVPFAAACAEELGRPRFRVWVPFLLTLAFVLPAAMGHIHEYDFVGFVVGLYCATALHAIFFARVPLAHVPERPRPMRPVRYALSTAFASTVLILFFGVGCAGMALPMLRGPSLREFQLALAWVAASSVVILDRITGDAAGLLGRPRETGA